MANSSQSNPALRVATLIHPLTSITKPLDLDALFETRQPIELELGSGDGSFLAQYATANPQRNFVGVERLLGRLRKLDRKGLRAGLTNLRLIRLEAAYLLEYLAPAGRLDAIHVYFPDPWPKRKHRKNRLVNERFTELTYRGLARQGAVFLRTDDGDYFEQMRAVFGADRRFTLEETPQPLAGVVTDFERNFNAQGISTLRAAFRRD